MEAPNLSDDMQPNAYSSFPQTPEEFDADPRVSFSKLDKKFILEIDEEHEFEYDDALKRWVPVVRPHPPIPRAILEHHIVIHTIYTDGESN